jgi:type IV pilus assembly protein PilV
MNPRRIRRADGYTLLEVLIALIVFSVGLLGLAAMLVSAVKGNHKAYYHSQAVNVAQTMADGLRANAVAVWQDQYDTAYTSGGVPANCTPCTPAQTAVRDIAAWGRMANTLLPNGQVAIDCALRAGAIAPTALDELIKKPAFNGTCQINVQWSESGDIGDAAAARLETFTWVIQP